MSEHEHGGSGRRSLAALAACTLLAGGLAAASPAIAATHPTPLKAAKSAKHDKLGQHDRERLAEARSAGKSTVTIMVTTTKGTSKKVAKQIRSLGGYIRYESSKLGYLSAVVPTAKVETAVAPADVLAVDLDEVVPLGDPAVAHGAVTSGSAGPGASTPDDNPYMPTRETGSVAFKSQHKAWDGRGVTIGILDSGVDLDNPALQTTSTGEKKIVDWFTATDPVTEGSLVGGDASWLPMVQDATGPTFPADGSKYRGSVWTLPATGTYKIRTMDESGLNIPGCELCDANRDGDRTDRIGVLYEPATHKIWVDTNDDKDFTDETPMSPYKASGQVGHIGADNPATEVHESIPFVVDYREHVDYSVLGLPKAGWSDVTAVDIGISSGEHGSHVAGIAAANDMFGGHMDGQAPGAKLVSARACNFGTGCTAAALTDGMAKLAQDGVDIINMSIGGLPALNDGNNARSELYNRIINDLGVQIVISAGNSSNALNTVGDPSVATDVVSVGADITKATWKSNYGSDVAFDENIMPFSSGGPREDGGFKPNITAPGAAVATINMWLPGSPVAEAGYALPAGYAMLQGTSMASPQATGAMALLLSAAKQEGVTATSPAALRRAVYSSAQWNPAIPAFLQGHGQIDVPGAWDLFRMGLEGSTIETTAPVCTEIWKILGETAGTGLYNRCSASAGGQAPGETRTYDVTLKRTTGKAKSGTYALTFKGNDNTFSVSPSAVDLPLDQPVTVKVTATPQAGAHSAVLDIDDPKTRGLDGSMMAVVAAGEAFPANYTITHTGVAKRNEAQRFYVTVPAGAKALQVGMSGLDAGSQTRFLAFHPYGLPLDNTSTPNCYSSYGTDGNGCNPALRTYADPLPGVWEILVESRRTSPLLDNPFTLTVKLLGASVDPATVTLDSVVTGQPTPVQWNLTNQFAGVQAHAVGGSLGSALSARPSINKGDQQTYTVTVPSGASRLDVRIGNPSDAGADLDLYLYNSAGKRVAYSADGDSEEAVSLANPPADTYKVVVEGYDVAPAGTAYDYLDVFYASSLGSVDVDGTPFDFASGATHTVNGTVTAQSSVEPGRSLFGAMTVVSDSGAVLGTGHVLINSVS